MPKLKLAMLSLIFVASVASAGDASERKFIERGDTEAKVLSNLGRADSESFDTDGGAAIAVKRWIYLPAPGDEQTTTTIVLRQGKVVSVTRQITR